MSSGEGLNAGDHAVLYEEVHLARFLGQQVRSSFEFLDAGTELGAEGRDIKTLYGCRPTFTTQDIVPGLNHRISHGTDHTETCYYHSSA